MRARTVVFGVLIALAASMVAGPAGAAPVVQRCTGPASAGLAGTASLSPGLNLQPQRQSVSMLIHLSQCAPPPPAPGNSATPPPTEVIGTLKTSFITGAAQTCAFITAPHSPHASATITWKNNQTSTMVLTFALTGSTRLMNVSGTITAGVFAGHTVSGQFRYRPVVSPNGNTLAEACANKVAPGKPGRVSVIGLNLFRTKDFTIT